MNDNIESINIKSKKHSVLRYCNDSMSSYSQHQILEDDDDFDPKTEDIHQYCEIIGWNNFIFMQLFTTSIRFGSEKRWGSPLGSERGDFS